MSRTASWAGIILMTAAMALPVQANETDRLYDFAGNWSGSGQLVGGDKPEEFRCRLMVDRGSMSKINYSGRCSLVNMNLSVAGTIAYNAAAGQYEAVMSSNAGFTGDAVGRVRGDRIVFDLQERQADKRGNDVQIGAMIELIGQSITVHFQVEFNDSGELMTAEVPFSRR
ncbi:hypothetical protein ACFSX5_15125 [Devosia albogilva]|uniref:DUF1794 domain-containing protein n=1 Tax=Devosia albogilva TaxID=429726 RepID=A0ABW5QN04_9HYPH